jgi:hypothetical protein
MANSVQDIQPSGLNPMAQVIVVVHPSDHHCFAGGRCMDEALAADEYSNMPGSLASPEEHEITRQGLFNTERVRSLELFPGSPWHEYPRFTVSEEHETATIKAPRSIPAIAIVNPDHALSGEHDALKNGGVTRCGGRWSRGSRIG